MKHAVPKPSLSVMICCLLPLLALNALLMISCSMQIPLLMSPTMELPHSTADFPSVYHPVPNGSSIHKNYPIYGHIHVAKTAGTSLNILMAAKFSRVCGHKGYSFDFFQHNKRIPVDPKTNQSLQHKVQDSVSAVFEQVRKQENGTEYFRGRVYHPVMDERGYEECDWISNEVPWQFWRNFSDAKVWPIPLELHVPCRGPIEHLMSQCNYKFIEFDCQTKNLSNSVDECLVDMDRFNRKLLNLSNIDVKCFSNEFTFTKYIEYLQPPRMQLRRIPVEDPKPFLTNEPRNKEKECIWKNDTLQAQVISYLQEKHDYYRFCDECIGSPQDLFWGQQRK